MESVVAIQKLTVAEFRELEFDDNDTSWYELIHGEIVKKSAPSPLHQRISRRIEFILELFVTQKKVGEVFHAPIDVFLDGYNSIQPDILFVPATNAAIITDDGIEGVPALVVEIVSPTSGYRDRVTKKLLYQQHGVQEYWLVDPLEELIEVYKLDNNLYTLLSAATIDEGKIESAVLPGLVVDVKTLFAV